MRKTIAAVAIITAFMTLSACSEDEVDPTVVDSEYELDGRLFKIEADLFWVKSGQAGEEDQIRLIQEISEEGDRDMIVLIPVLGNGKLEGSYIYSKTGDIRTYDVVYVRNIKNQNSYDWITNGESGSALQIVRAGFRDGEPIYTLRIEDFDLDYGFYDFLADTWVSKGIKKFRFQYQGSIEDQR